MSKSELINSASEDKNNGTEETETSHDEYLSELTKLPPDMYETCVSKESPNRRQHRIGNILWCSGTCKRKATHAESICCLNKEEILESYFDGIISFILEIFLSSNKFVRSK